MSFNESQIRAIAHHKGPLLVLAGPGSGKTLVITHRTKKLIETYGVNPSNILVITFTKAAAGEMKGRFDQLMEGKPAPVTFGTFHSVFYRILKYAYNFGAGNIITDEQRMLYLRQIIDKMEMEIQDEKDFLSGISGEISFVKGEMLDLTHYYSKNCSEDNFKFIYQEYDRMLRSGNYIDFDDMLVMCYELFTQRKDILKLWQQKYQFILIDEFQDINRVQYDIMKLLAAPENNLFIVGDDDQSIYRFRGAKPEIMLGFEKDYEAAARILLDTNYRSTENIIEASLRVIRHNKARFEKAIKGVHPRGASIVTKEFQTPKSECEQIIKEIKEMMEAGTACSDIAILYRTNTNPRLLVEKMMEYNLPFRIKDSIPNLFDHWIAKNIISYLRIALGNRERSEFLQIINRPKRYVSRDCFSNPVVSFDEIKTYYSDKAWMIDRIEQLEYDLKMLKDMSPYAAISYIRNVMGYQSFLKEYSEYRRIKLEELLEILDDLLESSKEYKTFAAWFLHMEEYSKELMIQMKNRNEDSNSISLSTMHSSKGLEYKVVYIIDANEGITPHHKAVLPADIEEERRLFYVAMTRAKESLHIYSVKERYSKKMELSRFIGEYLIDTELLSAGARVRHVKYGEGIIRQRSGNKIIVYFERTKREAVLDITYCVSSRILEII